MMKKCNNCLFKKLEPTHGACASCHEYNCWRPEIDFKFYILATALVLFSTFLFLLSSCESEAKATPNPIPELGNIYNDIQPESDGSKEQMVKEIVTVWEIFFSDENVPGKDLRRNNFNKYAGMLADTIIMYQNGPTNRGGMLPKHPSTHYLLATMVTKESSVNADIISMSSLREVGLLQVHGKALAGHKRNEIRDNPALGILLGVRWLTIQLHTCYPNGFDNEDWSSDMWIGPMSIYAAGNKAMKANGTCGKIKVGRQRVKLANRYKTRVEAELND